MITSKLFNIVMSLGLALLLNLTLSTPAHTAAFEVNDDTIPDGDPGSLRHTIVLANANGEADNIQIRAGTYILTLPAALEITDDLAITGEGTENTIIDGNFNSRVFMITGAIEVKIERVKITAGSALFWPDDEGGGIFVERASLTLSSCEISGNDSIWGAGIFGLNASITLEDCDISDNYADSSGGGMETYSCSVAINNSTISDNLGYYTGGISSVFSTLTITNSTFDGNFGELIGGGFGGWDSDATITDSLISNNTSEAGGGMYCNGSLTIEGSIISGNRAYDYGGGILSRGSLMITNSTVSENSSGGLGGGGILASNNLDVSDCFLFQNSTGGDGGGIWAGSSSSITNSTFIENEAGGGGAIYNPGAVSKCTFSKNKAFIGGALYIEGLSTPITNSIFVENEADYGGAIVNGQESSPEITNSIFSKNRASRYGGGIYNEVSLPAITNCSFNRNYSIYDGGAISNSYYSFPTITNSLFWEDVSDYGKPEIYNDASSSATVTYSDVEGGYPGFGNLDDDPLFVDPEKGDFHLTSVSPCIDAATPEGAPNDDIDGDLRPQGAGYDIGADEYVVSDSDGDGIPDDEDACPLSDLNDFVAIDACESGVQNVLLDDGCTVSDLISRYTEDADNHGEFVSSVSHTTNYLKKIGKISGKEKGKIQKCAAKADIP